MKQLLKINIRYVQLMIFTIKFMVHKYLGRLIYDWLIIKFKLNLMMYIKIQASLK
jgi:hypothetical protein